MFCYNIVTIIVESESENINITFNHIQDVLSIPEEEKAVFNQWIDTSFGEALPFDTLKELASSIRELGVIQPITVQKLIDIC